MAFRFASRAPMTNCVAGVDEEIREELLMCLLVRSAPRIHQCRRDIICCGPRPGVIKVTNFPILRVCNQRDAKRHLVIASADDFDVLWSCCLQPSLFREHCLLSDICYYAFLFYTQSLVSDKCNADLKTHTGLNCAHCSVFN